jgi:hypothetical protein
MGWQAGDPLLDGSTLWRQVTRFVTDQQIDW